MGEGEVEALRERESVGGLGGFKEFGGERKGSLVNGGRGERAEEEEGGEEMGGKSGGAWWWGEVAEVEETAEMRKDCHGCLSV